MPSKLILVYESYFKTYYVVREMRLSAMDVKLQISGNGVTLSRLQYFIALLVLEVKVFLSLQRNKASMLRHVFFVLLI